MVLSRTHKWYRFKLRSSSRVSARRRGSQLDEQYPGSTENREAIPHQGQLIRDHRAAEISTVFFQGVNIFALQNCAAFSKTPESQFFSIARHGQGMINSPPIHAAQMTSAITEAPVAEQKLVRGLGLLDSTMLVAGSMIGSGIFIVSADISRQVGSPGWLLVVWIITGLLTLTAALSYGELAAMMPKAGGQYVYLREAFSPLWGFLYGWTLFLVIQTGTIAAVAVGFARYSGVLLPW